MPLVFIAAPATVVAAADGDVDTNYGTGGLASLGFDEGVIPTPFSEWDSALDASGNFYVVGATTGSPAQAIVLKYDSNGRLNRSLAGTGFVTHDLAGGRSISPKSIAVQEDGDIVIGGEVTWTDGFPRVWASRLNPDGSVDTAFGNGFAVYDLSGGAWTGGGEIAVMETDNGPLTYLGGWQEGNNDIFVARLGPTGELDTSFGGDGIGVLPMTGVRSVIYDLDLGGDGSAYVATEDRTSTGSGVGKLTNTGVPDTSFDGDGVYHLAGGGWARAIDVSSLGVAVGHWNFSAARVTVIDELTASPISSFTGTDVDLFGVAGTDLRSIRWDLTNDEVVVVGGGGSGQAVVARVDPVPGAVATNTALPSCGGGYGGQTAEVFGGTVTVATGCGGNAIATARVFAGGALDETWATDGFDDGTYPQRDVVAADVAVLPDGSSVVVGVQTLADTDNSIFLAKFTSGGDVDPTFNNGLGWRQISLSSGTLNATSIAVDPATGLLAVAGFGDVAPYPLTGSMAFALLLDDDGRVLSTLDGPFVPIDFTSATPASAHATDVGFASDGKVVVAGHTGGAASDIAVTRLIAAVAGDTVDVTADPTFSGDGVAVVETADTIEYGYGLEVHPDGGLVLAGTTQANAGSSGFDATLVRLDATGAPVASFGTNGVAVLPQNVFSDDFAVAADVRSDGTIGVAWYEDIEGATPGVLVLGASGAPISAFGGDGSYSFSWSNGTGGSVSDIEFDGNGRLLVTGYPAVTTTLQVARFLDGGANPTDTSFAGDGIAEVACAGGDAVGIGLAPDGSIYVGGGCGVNTAVAKFTTQPTITNLALNVSPNPGELVNLDIPLASVDRSQVMPNAETLAESPWRASPWRASPWRASPWRASPWRASPWRASPWRASPWRASPWRASPWRASPWRASPIPMVLAQSPLHHEAYPGGWQQVLDTHPDLGAFRGRLAQNVTFQELPDAAFDHPLITMDHIDFTNSPFGELSLGALLYGSTTLTGIDPARDWCVLLANSPLGCTPSTTTLAALEFVGVDVSSLWSQPLVLRREGFHPESPLATMPLNAFDLAATPAGAIVASRAQTHGLLSCTPGSDGCSTLGEAQQAGHVPATATLPSLLTAMATGDLSTREDGASVVESMTLGELLVGLIPTEEFPFDQVPLDQLLALQGSSTAGTSYVTTFDIDCASTGSFAVDLALPIGMGGPATAIIDVGGVSDTVPVTPSVVDPNGPVSWQAEFDNGGAGNVCGTGTAPVVVTMEAPGDLVDGAYQATAAVSAAGVTESVSQNVDDSIEADEVTSGPGDVNNNDPGTADLLVRDRIVSGYVSAADDVDYFNIAASSLPVGSRVTAILSHIPEGEDFDLGIFGDGDELDPANGTIENSPWRASPWRASPWRASPVEDGGLLTTEANNLVPETLQDVPWRASELDNAPWRASSINRGNETEVATTLITERDVAEGRVLTLQVSGYDGSSAALPYILRLKVEEADGDLTCITRPYPPRPASAPLADLPATTGDPVDTLILVNEERFGRVYEAGAEGLRDKLDLLAGQGTVNGLVIPVDGSATVNAAYAAWDHEPCSIQAANDVVGAVNQLVDTYKARLGSLKNIVLVGDDELIPFARVLDQTTLANQIEYRRDAAFNGFDNPISRAFGRNQLLTDDPYGDFDPAPFVGGTLYLPDVAIGRLVETPLQITEAIDRYIASDGVLNPTTSYTAGYDFLKDMATEVERNLRSIGAGGAQSRIDDLWTGTDMIDALSTSPGIASINAHYNHYGALPAAGLPAVTTAQVTSPLTNSLLFTIGCNAGVPVNDIVAMIGVPQTTPPTALSPKAKDWAQTVSGLGGNFAANTGFGIGDTEAIVLSEQLFVNFSELLASKTMTVGQAFAQAKQRYFAALGVIGVYDAKISQQATFYGLPMSRLAGVTQADAFMPDAGPGATASSTTGFQVTPTFDHDTTARGTAWTAAGSDDVQATHYRPLQPRVQVPVTSPAGQRAHGVILEELASIDVNDVDPIYSMPTRDNGAVEPEPVVDEVFFPSNFTNLTYTRTPGATDERLVLVPGQFFTPDGVSTGGRGTQRLFTRMAGKVLHSSSTDFVSPEMRIFDAIESGTTVTFSVDAQDPTDSGTVERVLVLYRDTGDPTWKSAELAYSAATGRWIGLGAITSGSEISDWLAQAVDGAGNVGVSTNKGRFFEADPLPATLDGFVITPEAGADGIYDEPPTIRLAPGTVKPGTTYEVSANGGSFVPFTNDDGYTPVGDGIHRVAFRGSDGSEGEAVLAVDATAPAITITSPTAGEVLPIRSASASPVTPQFECRDGLSGVASCVATSGVTTDGALDDLSGGEKTFAVTAVDVAGNRTVASVTFHVGSDTTAPTLDVTLPGAAQEFELNQPVTPAWQCTDGQSPYTCSVAVTGDVRADGTLDTSTIGEKSVAFTATDGSGNPTVINRSFRVVYKQIGFFSPVNNLPTRNVAKAGSTVPVKFRLSDHGGTVITSTAAIVARRSQTVACDTGIPTDTIEEYLAAAGTSELRYDALSQTFIYNWKTTKTWAGQCRLLTLEFDDGETQQALFEFRK